LSQIVNLSFLDAKLYHAGIDKEDGFGVLTDPGLGEWAYRTQRGGSGTPVQMISLARVLAENEGYVPFILKVDIEGYEDALFSGDTTPMDLFPVVIIELHDWMGPERKSSVPFVRWHASRKRIFHFYGESFLSVDWDLVTSSPVVFAAPEAVGEPEQTV
jgi:Methyltransferase FkbM domain